MIDAVFPAMLGVVRGDAEFRALWSGVVDHLGESAPYIFPGMAPDDWPKPYVVYSLYDNEAVKFGRVQWPMKDFYVSFVAHDYGPDSRRAYLLADRVGALLAFRGLDCDPTRATGVRLYENEGPVMVESDKKRDVAWMVTLPLRGYDVGAATTKLLRGGS